MKRGKAYGWIPLWIDKWLIGSTRFELDPAERSVFVDLLVLGGKDDGYIRANKDMGYPPNYLAHILNVNLDILSIAIKKCVDNKKIDALDNGVYRITNWDSYQLTPRHKRRVMSEKEDHGSLDKDPFSVSVSLISSLESSFLAFWEKYPRKESKKDARKAWDALMKKEIPATIDKALANYIVKIKAEGTEQKYIKLPATFLREERWKDYLENTVADDFNERQLKALKGSG